MGKARMQKQQWWKDAVVYQIYPRSFQDSNGDGIGDLNGIRSRLDYLRGLGVDVIWLCPVYRSPNDDNGYDISDYQAIQDDFGTMADFDSLLADVHAHGMKLIMDLVVNHTSSRHPWFLESRSDRHSARRNWYIWRPSKKDGGAPNNWGSRFQGSAWEYDGKTEEWYLHIFTKKMPDLNWECESMRREVYRIMRWWGEKGIDGFRMDVITSLSKDQRFPDALTLNSTGYGDGSPYYFTGPREHEFLQEMNREVLSHYDWMTVGEGVGLSPEDVPDYAGENRHELCEMFHFDHLELMQGPLGKWTARKPDWVLLKKNLAWWQTALEGKAWDTLFWENHDYTRCVSRFGDDSAKWRTRSAKMLAVFLYMMKGTPYIYQGQELGMTNFRVRSPDQLKDVESINAYHAMTSAGKASPEEMLRCVQEVGRDQARTPMQWDGSENAGFSAGTPWMDVNPNYRELNAEEEEKNPDSVLNFYRELLRIRKEYRDVLHGTFRMQLADHPYLGVYVRENHGSRILVACNHSDREQVFRAGHASAGKNRRGEPAAEPMILSGKQVILKNTRDDPAACVCFPDGTVLELELRPYEAAVWQWNACTDRENETGTV